MKTQIETDIACLKLDPKCVDSESHDIGLNNGEPLIYGLDGMLRYAKAYRKRFDTPLSEDPILGGHWLDAVNGLRGLLNGDGAVAMEVGRSTDSKSNGVCEAMYWAAINEAGFTEPEALG